MEPDEQPEDEVGPEGPENTAEEAGGPPDSFDDANEAEYFERLFALKKAEEDRKQVVIKAALAKFNVFLHLTAYVAGIAYLLLLGVLYRPALPWVAIPIILWTAGITYHFYWAFSGRATRPK